MDRIYIDDKYAVSIFKEDNCDEFNKIKQVSRETGIDEKIIFNYVDNWFKIDGEWYLFKGGLNQTHLLNELLGEVISEYFKLDTVHYKLAGLYFDENVRYGIISKNFYQKGYSYIRPWDLKFKRKTNLDVFDEVDDINLLNDLKKFFIRDFYVSQADRTNNNFLFKVNESSVSLAPLYDYEYSFDSVYKYYYRNAIGQIDLNSKKTIYILNKDDDFQKLLYMIMDADIIKLIEEIENRHKIIIPKFEKDYYKSNDSQMKKLVLGDVLLKKH